jgi:hypothetical protein
MRRNAGKLGKWLEVALRRDALQASGSTITLKVTQIKEQGEYQETLYT